MLRKLARFAIYGVAGWGMEVLWTGLYSLISGNVNLEGFTTLWMFPVYGCAVLFEYIHDIIRRWTLAYRGLLWVILIWGMEYTAGLIFARLFGVYPWHYDGWLAIDGFIRLDYAPAWFLAGLFFEKMHDIIDRYEEYREFSLSMSRERKIKSI